jgi:hypothetical protein
MSSLEDDFSFVPLLADGDYGIRTEKAVRLFQLIFTGEDGQALYVDGTVGPATWASLFGKETVPNTNPAAVSPFLQKVVSIASTQVGVMEVPLGSNRGPEVDQYILSTRLDPAAGSFAWCVAFLYWCFEQAAAQTGRSNPMFQTAGVHVLWNKSLEQPKVKRITPQQTDGNFSLVRPGQIFCIDFGSGLGHAGLVESVDQGKLVTIEGNTNLGGSRQGIGVFRRNSRLIEQIDLGFIDYSNA